METLRIMFRWSEFERESGGIGDDGDGQSEDGQWLMKLVA